MQRTFEEEFEDKVIPVFAHLCEFLHAVESMWRQAWNNELTQASTVTEQEFILIAASGGPADMNVVYFLSIPACLQPFVGGTV